MILDTNAVSDLLANKPNLAALLTGVSPLCVPIVVVGEYRFGLRGSRMRAELSPLLDEFLQESIVLQLDLETTEHYAEIREELRKQGKPIPVNDLWVAALARQHALPVVSKDEHFDRVPRLERRGW